MSRLTHAGRWVVLAALVGLGRGAAAQAAAGADAGAGRPNATRQELEQLALEAERSARASEAAAIRARLRDGDFREGDRIVLTIEGDSALDDTVIVRPGPTLAVLSIPDDTLRGVLRSELQEHLSRWVMRYYKNATVRATPLIRFGILGEVTRPGYYRLPVDVSITDAVMIAGGPTSRSDMPRTIVRRRNREVLSKGVVRDAIAAGITLDQLGLDAGDELVVSPKPQRNWVTVVQMGSLVTGLLLSLQASRRF
jgi:hypothetical protein